MTRPAFLYEHCDAPEGLTISEWQKARYVAPVGLWARLKAWCGR